MENVILLKPNGNQTYHKNLQDLKAIEPPLFLACLASKYENPLIVDAELENYTTIKTVEKVLSYNPSKVVILATGNHPSSYVQQKEEMLKLDILLSKHTKVEAYSSLPCNPVGLGAPRLDLLDYNRYRCHNWHSWTSDSLRSPYGVLYTSISCTFQCIFCAIKAFYGDKYTERPLEDIYKDLDYFYQNNVVNIKIIDELFVYKKGRVKAICEYISKNGYKFNIWAYARIDIMDKELLKVMKKAGINWLCYGIETGNDDIRRSVLKGNFSKEKISRIIELTKDNGINCLGNYMFGFWEDTLDTMKETLYFAIKLNCEFSNFYCVVAYPNSPLYEQMIEKEVALPTNYSEYAQMSEKFKPLPTKYLTSKEVLKFRDEAFNTYFNGFNYNKNMIEKFGVNISQELAKMNSIKIERNNE